jgi:hypothetical protein
VPQRGNAKLALTLNRLGEQEISALIKGLAGNKVLPDGIRDDIIERTDGIPLFVEEMTKAVLEAENESEAQATTAVLPRTALAVPPSLHASLMARLDCQRSSSNRRCNRGGSFLTHCWWRWRRGRTMILRRRLIVSSKQGCYSGKAFRPTPTISLSSPNTGRRL